MVEVRLHGELAKHFGKVFHFDIQTPREAVAAIEAAKWGFRKLISDLSAKGMVFRVRTEKHDYVSDEVDMSLGSCKRIDFIPIVAGSSAGVRFVIGAVLVVVGVFTTFFGDYSGSVIGLGLSLMAGAVTEWLTPNPKKKDQEKNAESWTINGSAATAEQGSPVPIIYGEVLVGGYTVSAGILASQVSPGGSLAPDVTIGGRTNYSAATYILGTCTLEVNLTAGIFNIDEPLSYAWSHTGFANATATRMTVGNAGMMRLELDYTNTTFGSILSDTGNCSVTVTGRESSGTSSTTPAPVSITRSQAVTVDVQCLFRG